MSQEKLTPNSKKVFDLLNKSSKPLSAYEIMEKLSKSGIKAPPTVYRALDSLAEQGLVHRIESINAFVSCHNDCEEHQHKHSSQFTVCRKCGKASELHDHALSNIISSLCKKEKFHIEQEVIEVKGLCSDCYNG